MGPPPRDVVGISSDEGEGSPRLPVSPGSLGRVALLGDSPVPVPVPVPVPRRKKGKSRGARPSKDNDDDDDPPVPAPRRRKGKSRGVRPRTDNDDEDDDCVILDGDPDGPAVVAGAKGKSAGDGASDEVEIVAAKGEVACKDFPHSRHLCAELPFGTTPHPNHCRMCYCYVCDTPAPCKHWGKGLLDDDHCHATDEETKWETLRQSFKSKTLLAPYPEKQQNLEPGEEATVSVRNLPYNFDIERLGQLFRSLTTRVHAKVVDRGTG